MLLRWFTYSLKQTDARQLLGYLWASKGQRGEINYVEKKISWWGKKQWQKLQMLDHVYNFFFSLFLAGKKGWYSDRERLENNKDLANLE